MKHLLMVTFVAAGVVGWDWASAQVVNEPQRPPAAAWEPNSPAAQPTKAKPAVTASQGLETTGQTPPAADNASEEEARTAAEARRARNAVGRTLERTRELSRSELSPSD